MLVATLAQLASVFSLSMIDDANSSVKSSGQNWT
jgi:hypothetical protein